MISMNHTHELKICSELDSSESQRFASIVGCVATLNNRLFYRFCVAYRLIPYMSSHNKLIVLLQLKIILILTMLILNLKFCKELPPYLLRINLLRLLRTLLLLLMLGLM